MSERPLCVVSELGDDGVIYANREGLEVLRTLIDKVLSGDSEASCSVYQDNPGWAMLTVELSTHQDFETSDGNCKCGCQDKFADVEAEYQRNNP